MQKPKKRRRKKIWIALVLLIAIGGSVSARYFRKSDELITVQVEKVTKRDITETVVANGKIQPVTQVMISPEVAGEIVELPVVEGQIVKKGDLLVQIKQENYKAGSNSAEANYKFALGSRSQAEAELQKAELDYKRNEELFKSKLVPENVFMDFKTSHVVAKLRLQNAVHQVDQARFALDKANDDLAKTTITSPIDGTVTKLKSQLGERVLGTSFNMGTEMMTIAKLDEMEARVDIGEIDVVLIEAGQNVRIEADAFKDRKFKGTVTAIANAAKGSSALGASSSQSQEAPKFEVKIRIDEKEAFRPGMSVTAEIETRSRKGVLAVPIQSVTTRLPIGAIGGAQPGPSKEGKTEPIKPVEVIFTPEGDHVKKITVKTGISDSDFFEIVSGLTENQQIVSGGYKAISKDLEDGKKVKIGADAPKSAKEAK